MNLLNIQHNKTVMMFKQEQMCIDITTVMSQQTFYRKKSDFKIKHYKKTVLSKMFKQKLINYVY